MKRLISTKLATVILALPWLLSTPSHSVLAQQDRLEIEEVVVTARRRAEDLQAVPESVTVIQSKLIEDATVRNLRELSGLVPSMNVYWGEQSFRAGVIQLVVRGIGTPQTGEAPVSFVVDGVTAPENDFINQELFDIESVQVMRGPQGALYGRGALGGAILITTKQPAGEFSGFAKAGFEEGDEYRIQAGISGPVSNDNLFFKLSGSFTDREGLIENVTLNEPLDFKESKILRGGMKYVASDTLQIDWNFNYLDSELGGGIFGILPIEQFNTNFGKYLDSNVLGRNERDIFETSLKIEWGIGKNQFTSISALADVDDELVSDADFSALADTAQRNATAVKSFTQELRLMSPDEERLRWILGAFYQDRAKEFEFDFALDDRGRSNADGSFADRFTVDFEQRDHTDSTAVGLFAQLSYDVTDRLEATGALRYDEDRREFQDPRNTLTKTKVSFNELQPKVSLAYSAANDLLGYVTYSHGFRSGGFNEIGFLTGDFDAPPSVYQPETSDSIELGVKSTVFGGNATLNAAVFYTDLENNQFTAFDLETFTLGILSIDQAEIKGFESEMVAGPTDGLNISLGVSVIDTKIVNFDGTGINDGNDIPFVPDYSVNLGAQYTTTVGDNVVLSGRVDYNKLGEFAFAQDNVVRAKSTATINLRVGVEFQNWSIAGYLKNATDERVAADYFDVEPGLVARAPNAPRALGIDVRLSF